ncbi:MAG: DegT/DnrJ/EryC1/StrS family aminotransferase [bacterium]
MIPVCAPLLGEEEIQNVMKALKNNQISGTFGEYIDEFEKKFSEYCGCKYGVATTSGTTALHLALASLDIKRGDEVILSTLTNIATAYAVVYCNATPVTVDSEPVTWNIDPRKIEQKITENTKVILPVHIYGHPCNMELIVKIARKYNLYVVEDAAEAHGAEYFSKENRKWQKVGAIGDIGCFSFYSNKIITTGEGGMIVTNNKEICEKAKLLRNLAFSKNVRFKHDYLGFNYRMTNLQAAIGGAQVDRIDEIIDKKRYIAKCYSEGLASVEGITLPVEMEWAKNVYWMYSILVEREFALSRDELIEKLREKGVETRTFFIPMNKQPVFQKMGLFKDERCPVAEELSQKGLYLPSGVGLKEEEIDYVINTIREISQKRDR